MKKINLLGTLVLLTAICLVSCSKTKTKNVALKNGIDSVSYAIGVQNGEQMLEYFPQQGRVDPKHMDEFVEGFLKSMYAKEAKSKNYEFGMQVGNEMKATLKTSPLLPNDSTKKVNKDAFVDGLVSAILKQKDAKMTKEQATKFSQAFFEKLQESANGPAIAAEKKFLAENKKQAGIVETASGLQYKVEKQGTGPIPGDNVKVKVNYTGTLTNGTKFDSSIDRGEPFEFNTAGGVIPAWIEAVKLMPVGSKWTIYAPSKLAYGSRDMGKIPPYSTLIFEIELVEISK
jgi:FKBP-type peptidyl-prolyl cis-trans isomerase